uniref:Uncharacterized protein n=1 Tax=Nothoprocta perdicaria TaxID=30464 RepID=A0A8C6YUD0_NOTPE
MAAVPRLLIDGDGAGDDRRINLLVKSFIKWCNSGSQEEGYSRSQSSGIAVDLHLNGNLDELTFISKEKKKASYGKTYTSAFWYGSVAFPVQTLHRGSK